MLHHEVRQEDTRGCLLSLTRRDPGERGEGRGSSDEKAQVRADVAY